VERGGTAWANPLWQFAVSTSIVWSKAQTARNHSGHDAKQADKGSKMKSKFVYVVVCLALLAVLAVYAANLPVASAATPPVWTASNTWAYNVAYDSGTGTTNTGALNLSVTNLAGGTSGNEYVTLADYVPDSTRISTTGVSATMKQADMYVNKANMQYTRQYATIVVMGFITDHVNVLYTYNSPVPGWPLNVGDTYSYSKTTKDDLGQINYSSNRQGKVLARESVTVPAGTYNC